MSKVKELVEFDRISAGMADIQEQGNFLPDTTTKEGYEASKRFVLDVTTPTRTDLGKAHKTAKAYWITGGKNVDTKKNEIMDLLLDIQKPHQEAYQEFDQIKKDEKLKFESDIQGKIDVFSSYKLTNPNSNSNFITDAINQCGETDTVEGFYHRAKDAELAKQDAMQYLNDLLISAVNRESEDQRQTELAEENRLRQIQIDAQQEAMRLQQEEIDRKQAEINRVENEVAARAQAEADEKQRLINEEEQAEREKQAAIEREEYAKQQAEIAAEKAVAQEKQRQYNEKIAQDAAQAKLEANKKHTGMVRGEIKDHLINSCGLDNATATKVVKALLKTNRVTINY